MTARRLAILIVSTFTGLTLLLPPFPAFANEQTADPNFILAEASIVISEISPLTNGSSANNDLTKEFIEIHNRTGELMPISNLCIVRDSNFDGACVDSTKNILRLSGPDLQPGEYRVINDTSAPDKLSSGTVILPDSGAQISLYYIAGDAPVMVQRFNYTKPSAGHSFQLSDVALAVKTPITPGVTAITPQEDTPPTNDNDVIDELPVITPSPVVPVTPDAPICNADDVIISEIVANPVGSDGDGGEYIELYNSGDAPAALENCMLSSDKFAAHPFTASDIIAPKSYTAFTTYDGLLNGGGKITFGGRDYDDIVNYPALKDDEGYALINGTWQTSFKLTPGAANSLPNVIPSTDELAGSLAACPAGKFRNPATNRCKTIESSSLNACEPGKVRNTETNRCRNITAGSGLTACKVGQYRSPETNRCRSLSLTAKTLTACKPDQQRNPETNRCRKVASSSASLQPCKEGYARNPETNRCRKETAASSVAFDADDSASKNVANGQNVIIVIITASLLMLFLGYEYRHSIYDKFGKYWPGKTFLKK